MENVLSLVQPIVRESVEKQRNLVFARFVQLNCSVHADNPQNRNVANNQFEAKPM